MLITKLYKKNNNYYIIIVQQNKKTSKFIEIIGYFQPIKAIKHENIKYMKINVKRLKFWIKNGVKSTSFLKKFISLILVNDNSL